jgi:hypothetical protein
MVMNDALSVGVHLSLATKAQKLRNVMSQAICSLLERTQELPNPQLNLIDHRRNRW